MPISSVDTVVTNPGSNGAKLACEVYTDSGDSIVKTLPFTAILWGTQNGNYELVNDTTPLPVTLGSTVIQVGDNSTTLSVDDGAGSLTVDGTVNVNCQDGAGNDIASAIATPGSGDRGFVVRTVGPNDQGAPIAVASAWPVKLSDGTSTATITTISAIKALDVNIAGGVGGSSMTDDAAFTPGSSTFTAAGGTYRSSRDNVDDNDGGAFAMTAKRALLVSLETITGDPCTDDGINAVKTMILDASGNQITSFGGGTQYTEADVDASITGTALMWEDTSDTLRVASASKPLPVSIISGGGSGGTAQADSSTFTFSTTSETPVGGVYHGTRDAVSAGETGAFAMTPKRGMYVSLETPLADSVMNDTLDAVRTLIVDGAGTQITTFGTEYDEDSAHTTGDNGVMALVVRRDSNTTLVDTDGDYAPLQVDANGALKVNIIAGAGSGGTSMADDAAFTVAATNITPVGGIYRSTRDAVDDNDAGAVAMTAKRAVYVSLETPLADSAMDDTLDAVRAIILDGGGSQITNFGTQYDEDSVHTTGEKGTMALAVRRDAHTSLVGTDGDYAPLQVNANGQLKVHIIASDVATGGTAMVDDAVFTVATSSITPAGGYYNVTRDSLDSGDGGAIALTEKRAVYVSLETPNADSVMDETINAVKVSIVDGGGTQITSLANTEFQEDAAHNSGDKGTLALVVRRDADTSLVSADGDYAPLQVDDIGCLKVHIIDNDIASGGTSMTDDSAFTVGATAITPAGGYYASTRDAVTDGDGGAFAMNAKRGMYVSLETPNSDSAMDDTVDAVKTIEARPATATLTNVASSASSVTLLSSAATRRGATIFNDSTSVLYVKFGATASTTSFTVKMLAGDYYELPQPCYTGVIDGIWSSAQGSARTTELT